MAETVWNRTCMDRYPNHLSNARKSALKKVNSDNLADTKGHGPKGMRKEVWDGLVDIWLTPEWKKKSDAGRKNRAAMPDAVLHTGGSVGFQIHKARMEAQLRRPVYFKEVYVQIHKKKDGEFVSERSKNFVDSYDSKMNEKYGENSAAHPVVDSEVWAEASGPNQKRRVLGGRTIDIGKHGCNSSFSEASTSSAPQIAKEQLKEVVNSAMREFIQTQFMPMLAPMISSIVGSQVGNVGQQASFQCGGATNDHEDDDRDNID